MYPIEDIYLMKAPEAPYMNRERRISFEKPGPHAWQDGKLDAIDVEVLSMPRQLHHRYLLGLYNPYTL